MFSHYVLKRRNFSLWWNGFNQFPVYVTFAVGKVGMEQVLLTFPFSASISTCFILVTTHKKGVLIWNITDTSILASMLI
jgi:hypothetical protein